MEKIYEVNFISSENGMYNLEYYNDLNKLVEAINIEKETEFDLFNTEFNELVEHFKDDTLIELKTLSDDERMKFLKEMFYNTSNENVHYVIYDSLEDFLSCRKEILFDMIDEYSVTMFMNDLTNEKDYVNEVDSLVSDDCPFVIEERTGLYEYDNIVKLIELNEDLRISEVKTFIENK